MKKVTIPVIGFNGTRDDLQKIARELRKNLSEQISNIDSERFYVFQKYISVIYPHFIVWVSAMQNSCVSPLGKYAASDNLRCEIVENHQAMLWNFMSQFDVTPDMELYRNCLFPYVNAISEIMIEGVKNGHGRGTSAVIFLLEETSKEFIPWMKKIAETYDAKDMTYVLKHGEADEKHSSLALDAYEAEFNFGPGSGQYSVYAQRAIERVQALLGIIFSPSNKSALE